MSKAEQPTSDDDEPPAKKILDELGMNIAEVEEAAAHVADIQASHMRQTSFVEMPHSASAGSVKVHLFQAVEEELSNNPLADDETVEWFVAMINEDSILIKQTGSWESREIDFEEIGERYEPLFVEDDSPKWGYPVEEDEKYTRYWTADELEERVG